MRVHWTEAARAQLRSIHSFIESSSPMYARRTVDRLTRRSQQLTTFPLSGRIVPDVGDANLRELVEGPYRIIYHILEEQVDIIAVVHSSQKWRPDQ